MTFNPAKRASPGSKTSLMTWPCRAVPKSFKAKSDRRAQPGGVISAPGRPARWRRRSWEPGPREDASQGDGREDGQEEEQPAEAGATRPRTEVELPDVRHLGGRRPRAGRAFVVGPAGQASESLGLEDLGDGDGAEGV